MAFSIRRVSYFYTSVPDQPGEAYKLLAQLASIGVSLLAFTGVPVGSTRTQLTLFPEDISAMSDAATKSGLALDGRIRLSWFRETTNWVLLPEFMNGSTRLTSTSSLPAA